MAKWTKAEEKALLDGVGYVGWKQLIRKCGGRSKEAISKKTLRAFGTEGITRGAYSLAQAQEETGYSRTQLIRASKALNQRWARTAKGGSYLINAEQLEDLVIWLRHDYWCKPLELYGCVDCGTSTKPHYSFGACLSCYKRLKRYAHKLGLPFTAESLLALLKGLRLDMKMGRIHHFLKMGRAPRKAELEALWEFVKP